MLSNQVFVVVINVVNNVIKISSTKPTQSSHLASFHEKDILKNAEVVSHTTNKLEFALSQMAWKLMQCHVCSALTDIVFWWLHGVVILEVKYSCIFNLHEIRK